MSNVLVVTSKVKKFIKDQSNFNTSSETINALSKAIEQLCKNGIEKAKSENRKTVMARDIDINRL